MKPFRVGVLGATGVVGQHLTRMLSGHPWFRLTSVSASSRSAGRSYRDAVRWQLSGSPPADVSDRVVRACDPATHADCDLVFSGLDSATARAMEPAFADAGMAVVSNASAYRMDDAVPLVIPEVNPGHLALIDAQRKSGRAGFIVTNPNCSVTGLAIALAPLHERFVIRRVVVATLQAVSGAGVTGPGALELLDNVIPFIDGEEAKIEVELGKLLGSLDGASVRPAALDVSAHCHRVPTLDGHLEAVSIEFERSASVEQVIGALREFRGGASEWELPSAPSAPIVVRDECDRPQPRLDRDEGGGMSVVVGRVRPCPVLGTKLELLSHNTVRGAAGAALINAELLAARGVLPRRGA